MSFNAAKEIGYGERRTARSSPFFHFFRRSSFRHARSQLEQLESLPSKVHTGDATNRNRKCGGHLARAGAILNKKPKPLSMGFFSPPRLNLAVLKIAANWFPPNYSLLNNRDGHERRCLLSTERLRHFF
jgi:hypothetical protein